MEGTRSNDERHSSQSGTWLAVVSSLSQMLQPEGKTMLTSASLISPSQPQRRCDRRGTLTHRSAVIPPDELLFATPAQIYSSCRSN